MQHTVVEAPKRPLRATLKRKSKLTTAEVKKKAKKAKTITWYKKELDRLFSLYVRGKYKKECYTCGYQGKLQCGHFVSRMYLATRWDEDNCRPQCQMCNLWGKGMTLEFEERLITELGIERVQQMKDLRKQVLKLDKVFYEQWISHYTEAVRLLQ